jgi:hypothetical protein
MKRNKGHMKRKACQSTCTLGEIFGGAIPEYNPKVIKKEAKDNLKVIKKGG